jgi:DNA-directed RNA polymerase subunit RPC12/RpoP
MEEMRRYRCLRCGHEYTGVHAKDGSPVERTCPKCRSNSIRPLPERSEEPGRGAR